MSGMNKMRRVQEAGAERDVQKAPTGDTGHPANDTLISISSLHLSNSGSVEGARRSPEALLLHHFIPCSLQQNVGGVAVQKETWRQKEEKDGLCSCTMIGTRHPLERACLSMNGIQRTKMKTMMRRGRGRGSETERGQRKS